MEKNLNECYFNSRGYCQRREVPSLKCLGDECEWRSKDLNGVQWKDKYWTLMRALREKVAR